MAVLETIRNFFVPVFGAEPEIIVPAPPTTYEIRPLSSDQMPEVVRLNLRCFPKGENYTKYTFEYLFNEPRTLSYRIITPKGDLVAFTFVMVNENSAAHLTTIGVAPEHRRRGVAKKLINYIETALQAREVATIMLEVRIGNIAAQELYRSLGYTVVQRIGKYYNNGEDCFLMMKSLISF